MWQHNSQICSLLPNPIFSINQFRLPFILTLYFQKVSLIVFSHLILHLVEWKSLLFSAAHFCFLLFTTVTICNLPKLVLEARPEGGRGRGRPRVEWEEYVEGLVRKRGRKLPEVRRLAQNRKECRKWFVVGTWRLTVKWNDEGEKRFNTVAAFQNSN